MYWDSYYPPYVSVAEKRKNALKTLAKLKKKDPNISPVTVDGKLGKTWWGKAWNDNLTRYADFSNRVGRGRSYVSHGAVIDLQITESKVTGLVQGSASTPYKVAIKITALKEDVWKKIKKLYAHKFGSLAELLSGKWPRDVGEILNSKGTGLFPEPSAMKFSCSCPDGAYMCKHVAATLFGVGVRLDEQPLLLFTLRKINFNDLIKETVADVQKKLLRAGEAKKIETKGNKKSRIISSKDQELSAMFGVDLSTEVVSKEKAKAKVKSTPVATRSASGPTKKLTKKKVVKKTAVKKATKTTKITKATKATKATLSKVTKKSKASKATKKTSVKKAVKKTTTRKK